MDEDRARAVMLLRAIETADGAREIWSDADRAWAGRTAAEIVGERASDDAFLAERATLALKRLAERYPHVASLSQSAGGRGWVTAAVALAAFVVGALGVEIGPAHRINLLAPPVLALLAWNLAVYVALVVGAIRRSEGSVLPGPLRRRVAALLSDATRPLGKSLGPRPLVAALARFATDWSRAAVPLWRERATRLLHFGAATLAAGAIAGLYVRGIALEYRAGWQSTFLDADDVARLLRVVLAPGAWLTGIAVPAADHLRALAAGSPGENAAPWIHLHAATVLLLVIVPRLALAALAGWRARRLATHFPMAIAHAYFQRLLRGWREGTARIVAIPYSYAVAAVNAKGFASVMQRTFPSAVDIAWLPPTPYGADELPMLPSSPLAAVAAVFNATATPERENHGAFFAALAARTAGRAPLVAIVDTSDFETRFGAHPGRMAERRTAWERALAAHGGAALFMRLSAPDVGECAAAVATRLDEAAS